MEIKRFAAIDIGSNAMRLLISNIVFETDTKYSVKKETLVRVPVRLGSDVFMHGRINSNSIMHLQETMLAFKHLMRAFDVVDYRACATSAMRDASNNFEVITQIKKNTSIEIDIINGEEEASIIYKLLADKAFENESSYLFVDVGGGSTELTWIEDHDVKFSQSFNIGTLRLLHNTVMKHEWDNMKNWIKEHAEQLKGSSMVGSGGNINKTFRITKTEYNKPILAKTIKEQLESIRSMSIENRILQLDMNPDRADVIVPALEIYTKILKWSGIEKIYVPKLGLSDGILKGLVDSFVFAPSKSN
jgi:exopolyphosphatase / guanosine-5'-triphosphate,3'-diphosphate pyrophosphatase